MFKHNKQFSPKLPAFGRTSRPTGLHLSILAAMFMGMSFPAAAQSACNFEPATSLTLQSAVERALCHQPSTQEVAAQLRLAQASEAQAKALRGPQVSASAELSRNESANSGGGSSAQAQIRFSQVLFDFGYREAQQQAAQASTLAAVLDTRAEAQSVMLETAQRYFTLVAAADKVRSAQLSLVAAQQALDAVQARFSVGDSVRVEVLQAQSVVAESRLRLTQTEGAAGVARASLAQYVGAGAAQPVALDASAGAGLCVAPTNTPDVVSLLDLARSQSPEMLAARERVQASQRDAQAARLQHKPTVTLGASMGASRSGQTQFGSASNTSAAIALTLNIPLFDSGLSRSQQAQALARADLSQARLDSLQQTVELSVVQADARLKSAGAACEAAGLFLSTAQEAEQQGKGRYEAGVGTLQDWLTLQARLSDARERHTTTRLELEDSRLSLAKSLGALTVESL